MKPIKINIWQFLDPREEDGTTLVVKYLSWPNVKPYSSWSVSVHITYFMDSYNIVAAYRLRTKRTGRMSCAQKEK